MAGYRGRWWVGGGWAIDGWLGRVTRPHHDIDLVVLRAEIDLVRDHFAAWTIWINEPGRFVAWDGSPLADGDDCLLARPEDGIDLDWQSFADHPATVELMLERSDGETWVYRRNPRLRDRLDVLGAPGGFLAPEVALLYKSSQHEVERNAADFDRALPHLEDGQRRWLRDALLLTAPAHPWLERLSGAAGTHRR